MHDLVPRGGVAQRHHLGVRTAEGVAGFLLMAVNLKAPFFMCSAAIPHLKATPGSLQTPTPALPLQG